VLEQFLRVLIHPSINAIIRSSPITLPSVVSAINVGHQSGGGTLPLHLRVRVCALAVLARSSDTVSIVVLLYLVVGCSSAHHQLSP